MEFTTIRKSSFPEELQKAYTEGVYGDTPLNRKMNRVGKPYDYIAGPTPQESKAIEKYEKEKDDFKNYSGEPSKFFSEYHSEGSSLPNEYTKSIKENQVSSYAFINSFLRGVIKDFPKSITNKLNQVIKNIDESFSYFKSKENFVCFRGVNFNKKEYFDHYPIKEGSVFKENSFSSTSLDVSKGKQYFFTDGTNSKEKLRVFLEIRVPKGKKILPIDSIFHTKENEVLLPRNSEFKVLKNKTPKGVKNVKILVVELM